MYTTHEDICRQCNMLASEQKQSELVACIPLLDEVDEVGKKRWIMTLEFKQNGKTKHYHCLLPTENFEYCRFAGAHKFLYSKLNPITRKLLIKIPEND